MTYKEKINFINKKTWGVYFNDVNQKYTSHKTARFQIPRVIHKIKSLNPKFLTNKKLLDIGCGNGNEKFKKEIENLNVDYYGCDPFNQTFENNINSIFCNMKGQADFVTLNNVLNTIKEKDVWYSILKQAKDSLNVTSGILFIIIYEGVLTKKEKNEGVIKKTPIETKCGWQNRMKTEEYLESVNSIFDYCYIENNKRGKIIIASMNKNILCKIS
jgi:hypothetical protein